jgi:hypothetical protein
MVARERGSEAFAENRAINPKKTGDAGMKKIPHLGEEAGLKSKLDTWTLAPTTDGFNHKSIAKNLHGLIRAICRRDRTEINLLLMAIFWLVNESHEGGWHG